MFSTRLHVCTRASLTDIPARILARKIARVGQVGGQVGEDPRACPARTNGQHYRSASYPCRQAERTTRRHSRDDPRAEVGEDVRVRVFPMDSSLRQLVFVCSRKRRRDFYARCSNTQSSVLQGQGQVTAHDRSHCARVHRLLDTLPGDSPVHCNS